MNNSACLYSTISPQALDTNERNTYGAFMGNFANVQNVNISSGFSRVNDFPITQGVTMSNIACTNGYVGIDSQCICPGSTNSMPYQISPLQNSANELLFEPFVPNGVPPISDAAKLLIAQRRPLPSQLAGSNNLDNAIPCAHTEIEVQRLNRIEKKMPPMQPKQQQKQQPNKKN